MSVHDKMRQELEHKIPFQQAVEHAFHYMDTVDDLEVLPNEENISALNQFEGQLQHETLSGVEVLSQLQKFGSKGTIAQTGGRYFGFVNGGMVPAAAAVKFLADVWDQNGGLYLTSPLNAKLEAVCESWMKDIFNLPESVVAGFVSGTSTANVCGLAAARFRLLKNQGWDVNKQGLRESPKLRIIAHQQVHSSIKKSLAILGYGEDCLVRIPSDSKGRIMVDALPELDNSCLVILQAGNVNTGAFDDFDSVCNLANKAGAWVHIDGAFGLWAAASQSLKHLTKGIEKADSWALDGHKTLNTPYDCGIVLCKDQATLVTAMQATGEYIIYSGDRNPMLHTIEMSKRARAIEMWATMKYLGKNGIDEMITGFNTMAKYFAKKIEASGMIVVNEIDFNQVMIRHDSDESTQKILAHVQKSGVCWCGGSKWDNKSTIRISVCSWKTNKADMDKTIAAFEEAIKYI